MGRNITTDQAAASGGGGGVILPPTPSSTIDLCGPDTTGTYPSVPQDESGVLPMNVSAVGEYIRFYLGTDLQHYSATGTLNWTATASAAQAGSRYCGYYWDKVDNKLYVAVIDTATNTKVQLAWVNTLTGATTKLGTVHTVLSTFGVAMASEANMQRTGGQGSGDLKITIASTTGMGDITFTTAGALVSTNTNILVNGVAPTTNITYEIEPNLYIGGFRTSTNQTYDPSSASAGGSRKIDHDLFKFVSVNRHADNATILGDSPHIGSSYMSNVGLFTINATNVFDWGGDVAVVSYTGAGSGWYFYRSCGTSLYDKTDFARWAKEQIAANGG